MEDEVPNPVEIKKKRLPPSIFLGFKTRKKRLSSGYGKNKVRERFRVLKKPLDSLLPYAQLFYWYDKKKKAIRQSRHYDPEKGPLLHGKYEKTRGKQQMQVGYFYKGVLHGRWEVYDKHHILLDKKKFHKGWAYDAVILYYDPARERIREVTPIHYGEKEGWYYVFHENDRLAVRGKYKHDAKIGLWKAYHPNGKEKRRMQYAKNPFDAAYTPVIVGEWDEKGALLYDRRAYLKSLQ